MYRGTLYPVGSPPSFEASEQKQHDSRESNDEKQEKKDVYTVFMVYYKYGEYMIHQGDNLGHLLIDLSIKYEILDHDDLKAFLESSFDISVEDLMDVMMSDKYQTQETYRLATVMKGDKLLIAPPL